MDTLPGLPDLHLKQYFKKMDYSSWQRSSRRKDGSGQKSKTVPWAHAAVLPEVATPSVGRRAARTEDGSAASSAASQQVQLDWPAISRPGAIHAGSTASLKTMFAMKKIAVALEPLPPKKDTTVILKTLIKLRREAIRHLEESCVSLQARSLQLTREISDANQNSFSSVRESITLHGKLGDTFAALRGWSRDRLGRARAQLRDVQDSAETRLCGLQEQLRGVTADVLKAQEELHTLRTYRDTQYPVKALKIGKMKAEIRALRAKLQDERESVASICKNEMERLAGKSRETEEDMLAAIAKQHLSHVSPEVQLMASRNCLMRKEIETFKKTIEELERTNEELAADVRALRRSRDDLREETSRRAVLVRADKCTPDMDVVLNIPQEEWLPI